MSIANFIPALFDNYFIKLVFLLHLTFFSLANISIKGNDTILGYSTYNFFFLLCVLLAILVDKSADILLVATAFNVISIVLDIILLITASYVGVMGILMIVFNLILRPLSTMLLLRNYCVRAGVDDPTGGWLEPSTVHASVDPRSRSSYQNIEEPSQTLP